MDLGFSLYECRTLCGAGELELTLPVVGGNQSYVEVTNAHEVRLITPHGESDAELVIELPRFAFAEIGEGQTLGCAVYLIDGREVARCPLIAKYAVQRKIYKKGILGLFS